MTSTFLKTVYKYLMSHWLKPAAISSMWTDKNFTKIKKLVSNQILGNDFLLQVLTL